MNKVFTYGLTREENEILKKQHTDFDFDDVSECFTDLLALQSIAMIINPDKISEDENEQLLSVYDGYSPLRIFTKPGDYVLSDDVCDIANEREMANNLNLAKHYWLCYDEFKDYLDAKVDEIYEVGSVRTDNVEIKRVELHCHTKMSEMYGVVSARNLVELAAKWGHKAITITDTDSVQAFPEAYRAAHSNKIKVIFGTELIVSDNDDDYVITLLVKNLKGLKNLYKLISLSHTDYYCEKTGMGNLPIEVVMAHREGLLIGSSLFGGEIHEAMQRGDTAEQISKYAIVHDYIELYLQDEEPLNVLAAQIGALLNKPVVTISDSRYLDPKDRVVHRILCRGLEDWENITSRHFRTTEEMLTEFAYLGEEKAYEVVVTNTNLIADMIEDDIKPIPDGFLPPTLDGAEAEMVEICNARAKEIYGEELPRSVRERLDYELNGIIKSGYSSIYMIVRKLVKKSNDDGYLVGSRGCVGASLVAYLLGITEIDPIKYNIPFETFAGLDGDKRPDIDLNFSGNYQAEIHKYAEELFGADKVFRAGTIETISERIAAGIVQRYFNDKNIIPYPPVFNCLVDDISGIKRTTGEHPGGVIIIPPDKEIYDFTPVQYPGNNKDSGVLTTHFDYHALDNTLYKFDLLGHDDPTILKKLEDLTGVDAKAISFDDERTLNMFINADTLGVPEFGTEFVRNIIKTAKPKTFDDLVKILGLSHGADVWHNNAESLIKSGTATISEVIALRDEIMVYLISKGIDRESAFKIMERVRKGRGLTDELEDIMLKTRVPEWYVESCSKIRYIFPKAHAVAYAMTAFRIAWFKAHYSTAFYKAYMDIKDDFGVMAFDISETKKRIAEIDAKEDTTWIDVDGVFWDDEDMLSSLRIRLEMLKGNIND